MASEQHAAWKQVRKLAGPLCYRVIRDPEGLPIVPGKYGAIEWFDGRELAVYSDHPRLFAKIWAIPGVRRHQTGDTRCGPSFRPRPSSRSQP